MLDLRLGLMSGGIAGFSKYQDSAIFYEGTMKTTEVDEYGEELIVNGDFSDGLNGWVTREEVLVVDERAYYSGSLGAWDNLILCNILEVGATYIVSYDIEVVSGAVSLGLGYNNNNIVSTSGSYSFEGETPTIQLIIRNGTVDTEFYLDNVSVKQITARAGDRQMYDKSPRGGRINFLTASGQGVLLNGVDQSIPINTITLTGDFTYFFNCNTDAGDQRILFGTKIGIVNFVRFHATYITYRIDSVEYDFVIPNDVTEMATYSFKRIGTATTLSINGVEIETKTIPVDTIIFDIIGTSADIQFFNGIVGDVSFIDQTLTPTQIAQQHNDPEHFLYYEKELQGDGSYSWVGYSDYLSQAEIDNVVCYLPMCEEDEYVRDLANYSEGVVNALVTGYTANTAGTNNTNTNVDNVFTIHNESDSTQGWFPYCSILNSNHIVGEAVKIKVTVNITSGTAYLSQIEIADKTEVDNYYIVQETLSVGIYVYELVGYFKDNGGLNVVFNGQTEITFDATVTTETRLLTATYPIAEYTDACRTDAQDLLKGLQTVGLKRDSLGVPYALADGIDLHGQIPALPIDMTDTELYSEGEFSLEFVIERELVAEDRILLYSDGGGTGLKLLSNRSYSNGLVQFNLNWSGSYATVSTVIDANKHHIIFSVSPTHLTMYVDKVVGTPVAHSFVPSGLSFADSTQIAPSGSLPLFKTHYKALSQVEVDKQYDKAILEGAFGNLLIDEQGNYLTDEDGNYIIIGD